MRLPTIQGIIDRRILVNYRVDADVAARLLPAPFRPKLANGYAMAGICLIRRKQIRPAFVPVPAGGGSENAAHRFAVGAHRARRKKGITASPLDEVPGIGPARKRALLQHFGSAKAVSRAGVADLEGVAGISAQMAKAIYDHFHERG